MFQPVHWFQFANDAAAVTSGEKEKQHLLNALPDGANGQTSLSGSTNVIPPVSTETFHL